MRLKKKIYRIKKFFIRIMNSEITQAVPIILLILMAHLAILIWVTASQVSFLFNKKHTA
ncbi:MAG: hypothetical protein RLZZ223_173 [Candidatus Parcubacteria bacterium]|jgi:hypothetical protein